jgi:hypothetical protein
MFGWPEKKKGGRKNQRKSKGTCSQRPPWLRELVSCSYAKTTQLNHQIRTRGVGYEHFQGYMFFDSWFLDYPDQKSKQKNRVTKTCLEMDITKDSKPS